MTDTTGFELRSVTRVRQGRTVLDSIDLHIETSGITALVGRSGAGKSSLVRLLNRLDTPDEGTVRWRGADLGTTDPCAHRRQVAHVAQRPIPFDGTVADNLRVADPALRDTSIIDLLGQVGIADRAEQNAATLSGGEAQRMCIARALVSSPDVILADEPTSALDGEARAGIEALAVDIAGQGVAWVWVSHDATQTRRLADRVIVMNAGRVLATGTVDEIDTHTDEIVRRSLTTEGEG
ncbi:MAG: ATP-binding cassette domain-containing protein [Actinomycetota bacterium]